MQSMLAIGLWLCSWLAVAFGYERRLLEFEIVLLAFDRPLSTLRALNSLQSAHYPPEVNLPLQVRIDRAANGSVNARLWELVGSFVWRHGTKTVLINPEHLGLQGQWLNVFPVAKQPVLVVEDDLEFSPFYYYMLSAAAPTVMLKANILGLALQRPQWQLGRNEHGRWRRLDRLPVEHAPLFSFPGPATWGLLVNPIAWNAFVAFARNFLCAPSRDYRQGAITTKWVAERGETSLISPLMFEYIMMRGEGMDGGIVYFWPGNGTCLATARSTWSDDAKPADRWYAADRLLADEAEAATLIQLIRAHRTLPRFNVCMDQIEIVHIRREEDVVDWRPGTATVVADGDGQLLHRVIGHLGTACRITRLLIVYPAALEATSSGRPVLQASNYLFDCKPFAFQDGLRWTNDTVRCDHRTGLYPDHHQYAGPSP